MMGHGFITSWSYFSEEVFRNLADPVQETSPPPDVFVEIGMVLVRVVEKRCTQYLRELQDDLAEKLKAQVDNNDINSADAPPLTPEQIRFKELSADLEEQLKAFKRPFEEADDAEHAHQALAALEQTQLPSVVDELDVLRFLESTYGLLDDEYDPAWAGQFAHLVKNFITKYHLPYKVRPPFRLLPLILGQASRIYELIEKCHGPHGDHPQLWEAFEEALYQLVRNSGDRAVPIHKMTSYLEAVAADRLGEARGNFGAALAKYESLKAFPHRGTIKDSLSKLYGFTSNYPGIRHPGNPPSRNRNLIDDDTLMLSFLIFAWSGYLHTIPIDQ